MDSTEVCGCGRPVRYMTKSGNACNKYGRCRDDATKTDGISSGLVAVALMQFPGESEITRLVRLSDAEAIISDLQRKIALGIASRDAEIDEREQQIAKQSAALKLVMKAIELERDFGCCALYVERRDEALAAIDALKENEDGSN